MFELGTSLREARERRGLSLDDAEAATMIRGRYLGALENERFDQLPEGAYRKSFLREYAAYLGLDAGLYAAEYDSRFAPEEPEHPIVVHRSAQIHGPLLSSGVAKAGLAVATVAVIGLAAWALGGTGPSTPTVVPTQPATPPPAARPPAAASPPAPAAPKAAPASVLTLVAARGACWLSVHARSEAGALIYERTLQQGQRVRFGLRRTLWIRLGAPWNLEATLGDRRISLPGTTASVLAGARGVHPAA